MSVERSAVGDGRSARHGAVFLSYASQDAEAARRICEALRAAGVEVWFDRNELVGGDAWDAKIRKQIKECALFVPVISAATEARHEGYFRREWKLAVERTHDMAASRAFLLPVVIDGTAEGGAEVPEEFVRVQWTRLPDGVAPGEFPERVKRLLEPRKAIDVGGHRASAAPAVRASGSRPGNLTRPKPRRWLLSGGALAAVAVALVAFFTLRKPAEGAGADKAVAVLPFANLSGDPAQEYFSDGITEEILDALARERDLRVPGRASAFAFKNKSATNADIARALNVGQLVEGSVRRAGNQVRISVSLWRASDGRAEPLEPVEGEMTGAKIFALQEAVARAVVQRLTRRITTAVTALPTRNMEAYDLFLRARALRMRSSGPAAYEAMNQFEQVVRLDPNFAAAWAGLAEVAASIGRGSGGFDMSEETRRRAIFAAARAAELGPDLPEAFIARASVALRIESDPDAAGRELATVARLQPQSADLARMRAWVEADRDPASPRLPELANRAAELDPENPMTLMRMGILLSRNGQFARADELLRRSSAIGQSQSPFHWAARNWITWTGDLAEGIRVAEACPESYRNEIFYRMLAPWQEQRGDWNAAQTSWEKSLALARAEVQSPGIRTATAIILTELGAHARRSGNDNRAQTSLAEARSILEAVSREQPDSAFMRRQWARLHRVEGDWSAARAALDVAEKFSRGVLEREALQEAKAALLAATGAHDEAIAILRAAHERGRAFAYSLRHEVELKPLHVRPAFQQLMREAEARANAIPRSKR